MCCEGKSKRNKTKTCWFVSKLLYSFIYHFLLLFIFIFIFYYSHILLPIMRYSNKLHLTLLIKQKSIKTCENRTIKTRPNRTNPIHNPRMRNKHLYNDLCPEFESGFDTRWPRHSFTTWLHYLLLTSNSENYPHIPIQVISACFVLTYVYNRKIILRGYSSTLNHWKERAPCY